MKQKNREVNPQNITNSGGSIFRVYDMGRWKVKLEKYSFCERKPDFCRRPKCVSSVASSLHGERNGKGVGWK